MGRAEQNRILNMEKMDMKGEEIGYPNVQWHSVQWLFQTITIFLPSQPYHKLISNMFILSNKRKIRLYPKKISIIHGQMNVNLNTCSKTKNDLFKMDRNIFIFFFIYIFYFKKLLKNFSHFYDKSSWIPRKYYQFFH